MTLNLPTNLNPKSLGCPAFLNKFKTPKIESSRVSKREIFGNMDKKGEKFLLKSLELTKNTLTKEPEHHSRSKTPDEDGKRKNVENLICEGKSQFNYSSTTTEDTDKIPSIKISRISKLNNKSQCQQEFGKKYIYSNEKLCLLQRTNIIHQTPEKPIILKRQFYSGRLSTTEKFSKTYIFQGETEMKIEEFQFMVELGKGFNSLVYLAKHKTLGMLFAIKVIQKSQLNTETRRQNLFRELKIHSYLKHPNILSLFKIIHDERNIYMVMEYANQGTLYTELKKSKTFSEEKTAAYMRDICKGVKEMHDDEIIHRDLKLENILLCQGVAKIGDLGCSVKSFCMRKSTIGSPAYLSPQQLNRNFYGKKVDIWSIGIMTYEMLLGVTPFDKQIMVALNSGSVVSQMKPKFHDEIQISEQAKDFLLKCLNKRQNQRLDINQVLSHPFLKFKESNKF